MAANRTMRLRSEKYHSNIDRRGLAAKEKKEEAEKEDIPPAINPWLVIFLLIVLVGSSLFQLINTASKSLA